LTIYHKDDTEELLNPVF